MTHTPDTLHVDRNLPRFELVQIKTLVQELYGMSGDYKELLSEHDLTWMITTDSGEKSILKVSNIKEPEGVVDMQVKAMAHINQRDPGIPIPEMILTISGKEFDWVESALSGKRHMIRMISCMPGVIADDYLDMLSPQYYYNCGTMMGRVARALSNFFHPYSASNIHLWDIGRILQLRPILEAISDTEMREICSDALDHAEQFVLPRMNNTRCHLVHQDAHSGNVMVNPQDLSEITAIFDFGDMAYNSVVCELAVAADTTTGNEADILAHVIEVAQGFDKSYPLEEEEVDLIYDVFLLRQVMTVIICAYRDIHDEEEETHVEGEGSAHNARKLLAVGREQAVRRIRSGLRFPVYSAVNEGDEVFEDHHDELYQARTNKLGNMWHFYDKAMHFTRGRGAYLYTPDGTAYLDAYNNVPQMGHSHPHIVKAIARQAMALNTNTRYVCDIVADYAERLTADLPEHLNACIFVNTGSEANDFAMQIAKGLSGKKGALVMDCAYHGCTELTAALSPEIYVREDWLETLAVPDNYRGPHAGKADAAVLYAADADRAINDLNERGYQPAAFVIDTALCSNGVTDVPDNYFNLVAEKSKVAGAMVIADEVQAGCGRMGSFWGFRANGLKDENVDIITMGKPVANAHPLGVVILSRELLDQFQQSVSNVFSTFGGNTVACAAGMAVLDVIERENLVAKSNELGNYLRARLNKLAETQLLIGNVRGRGMMTGLEFVIDRKAKTPATEQTAALLELMKENRVLVGSEGKDKNIFKLRPSLAWNKTEVDVFIDALDRSLQAL